MTFRFLHTASTYYGQAKQREVVLTKRFRNSEFIDFNTGTVKLAPIQLQFHMALAGPPTFADLVRLFQCRVEVWHLGVAVQMLHDIEFNSPPSTWSHAAYGLLSLTFVYFETIGKVLNADAAPSNTPAVEFGLGFSDVYGNVTTSLGSQYDPKEFYWRAHNGLFHLGSTTRGLWVHNERSISVKDFDIVPRNPNDPTSLRYYVNPHAAVRTIVEHFPTFIQRLLDPDARYDGLRAKFKKVVGDLREG